MIYFFISFIFFLLIFDFRIFSLIFLTLTTFLQLKLLSSYLQHLHLKSYLQNRNPRVHSFHYYGKNFQRHFPLQILRLLQILVLFEQIICSSAHKCVCAWCIRERLLGSEMRIRHTYCDKDIWAIGADLSFKKYMNLHFQRINNISNFSAFIENQFYWCNFSLFGNLSNICSEFQHDLNMWWSLVSAKWHCDEYTQNNRWFNVPFVKGS